MDNAKLKLDLPDVPGNGQWNYESTDWGATRFAPAAGLPYTTPHLLDNPVPQDGVVDLGNLPENSSTTFVASVLIPQANENDSFVAAGTITGESGPDRNGCGITPPSLPESEKCVVNLVGQTVRLPGGRDVIARDRWDNNGAIRLTNNYDDSSDDYVRTDPSPLGKVNADSWDSNPMYYRLYGAADVDLKDVDYTVKVAEGLTFSKQDEIKVITGLAPGEGGMGQLPGNGYTKPVVGAGTPVVSDDGKTITLHIDSMPAQSAFAITLPATPDADAKA